MRFSSFACVFFAACTVETTGFHAPASGGEGIIVDGDTMQRVSVDSTKVPVIATCEADRYVVRTQDGWACSAVVAGGGTITEVEGGEGLDGRGTSGKVTLDVDFGVANNQVARGDHQHADLYYPRSETYSKAEVDAQIGSLAATVQTVSSSLERLLRNVDSWGCPDTSPTDSEREMIRIGSFCIDAYEISLLDDYSIDHTTGAIREDTECRWGGPVACLGDIKGDGVTGIAQSRYLRNVLAHISWFQAAALCANAGKRLCTNQEWTLGALGTTQQTSSVCNVSMNGGAGSLPMFSTADDSNASPRAAFRIKSGSSGCRSERGVYDMVGNVSEWVDDWSMEPGHNGDTNPTVSRWLEVFGFGDDHYQHGGLRDADEPTYGMPGSHYVAITSGPTGARGRLPAAMRRGGDHSDGTQAGVFAIDLRLAPTYEYDDLGARCCAHARY